MIIATVDTSIRTPITRMNAGACGEKKKTTEEAMPSTGSNCINTPLPLPRGGSGGVFQQHSRRGDFGWNGARRALDDDLAHRRISPSL